MEEFSDQTVKLVERAIWIKNYILNSKYLIWLNKSKYPSIYMYCISNGFYVGEVEPEFTFATGLEDAFDFKNEWFIKRWIYLMKANKISKYMKFTYKKVLSLQVKMDMPIA